MSGGPRRGLAHLIGSVPLPSGEEVFRRLASTLGPVLSRMPDGETGERRRIDAARAVVGRDFGVATECGWGRGDPARLDGLLQSHLRAVDYVAEGARR